MSAAGRKTEDPLAGALQDRIWEFEFMQAVTLLQRLGPTRAPVGAAGPFSREGIRFVCHPPLASTASEVRSAVRLTEQEGDGDVWQLAVTVFGLYGGAAPGPAYLLEEAAGRGDPARTEPLRRFLDVFGNRLTGLFYRSLRRYHWPLVFRRGGSDVISRCMFSVMGLGTSRRNRTSAGGLLEHERLAPIEPRTRLLRYLGAFSQRVRNPENLRRVLWNYLGGPDPNRDEFIEIEEFVPRWLAVEPRRHCRLGRDNHQLGSRRDTQRQLILGERVHDCLSLCLVVAGPLSLDDFRAFLPDGEKFRVVTALTDLYRPVHLDYDLRVRLRADEVPSLRIGREGRERLGWSTWLQTPSRTRRTEGVVTFRRRNLVPNAAASLRRTA